MTRLVNSISGRLSLRPPQRDALEILDRVTEIVPPSKSYNLSAALATIQAEREKVAAGGQSELMDILISRDWNDLMGPFTQNPAELIRPPVTR